MVQLGHGGAACPDARIERDAITMTVIDTVGIWDCTVMFCCCVDSAIESPSELHQVMQMGWYPATKTMPRTVATFALLDLYESITCEGKMSAYHFYKSLIRQTDKTGCTTPVCETSLLPAVY